MTEDRESERERLAYHRAGYGVALYSQGRRVPMLSLTEQAEPPVPDEGHTPRTWEVAMGSRARHEVELEILARWTALVSESRECFDGREPPGGWGPAAEALSVLGRRVTRDPEENEAYLEWIRRRAQGLIGIPEIWAAVQAVAQALLEKENLSPRETSDIVTAVYRARRRRGGIAGFFNPR